MSLERVGEGRQFPGSQVRGEKQYALAAGLGAFVVFESVVDDDVGDIFAGVTGKEADFGKLASERDEFSAHKTAAIFEGQFWKGQCEVAHADGAQAAVNMVDG